MSDIQRWHLQGLPGTTGIVDVMLYADHLAAVASEYERGRVDECAQRTLVYGNLLAAERQQGVSDERARIRQAVFVLPGYGGDYSGHTVSRNRVLAVIEGEES